jgi:hypothetical protein
MGVVERSKHPHKPLIGARSSALIGARKDLIGASFR